MQIPIDQVSYIEPGDSVAVSLDGLPGEYLVGTVAEIARQRSGSSVTHTATTGEFYSARIAVSDADSLLLQPGMLGRASITAEQQTMAAYARRWLASLWRFH